jgi:hypothetical protein
MFGWDKWAARQQAVGRSLDTAGPTPLAVSLDEPPGASKSDRHLPPRVRVSEVTIHGDSPNRRDQARLGFDPVLDPSGDHRDWAEQALAAVDIQEGFIQAQRFYQRCEGEEDVADLPADLSIVQHAVRQEDGLWAQPPGRAHGHGAVDTEGSSLVGGGTDDAPAFEAADDHWLTA